MFKYLRLFVVCSAFGFGLASVCAQAPPKPADAKSDYSKEAFVVEEDLAQIAFENDGTSTRQSNTRVRIQSDAGVQRYSVLPFSYENATESLDIAYVRVKKPDGTVVETPADNIQDMAAEITRQAPFYSDLREKHVAVKGLGVGDVLEFEAHWHMTKPLIPGQFYFAGSFSHDSINLHSQLQISIPRDRVLKWKSSDLKPVIADEGARRTFTWTTSQLQHKSSEEEKKDNEEKLYQTARGRSPAPDVQLSTFQSWEQLGAWYNELQKNRVKPTPEIRAKAAELTKNATDDNAKLHAIYNYVSTQFHYIGVAFGIGRYQPHSAGEVLGNQYGDCKDKETLLASLLDAAGIKAYPALISSSRDVDPDVPSPAQFDHLIGVVPQGSSFIWLDTTSEVAPFGYLLSVLRDKRALVIPPDKPALLMTTPADPPVKALESFKIDAKLSDTGTLEGKIELTLSGNDAEIIVRNAFRRVPMPQWKDLVQQISYGSGFSGDVSEVTASSPERTDEFFKLTYTYNRKDFPQWSERRISSPLPPMLVPAPDTKPSHPILLGAIEEHRNESRVELPKGYSPELPARVELSEDFAEYHASYSVKDGVLQTERSLIVKLREVPLNQYDAYKKFAKKVADDNDLYIPLSSGQSSAADSYQDEIWQLPYSENADAAGAYDSAKELSEKHDMQGEINSLKRAVEIDPKFTRAWLWLGEVYKFTRQTDLALQAYRTAIETDPEVLVSYKALGYTLMSMQKYEEAVPVWQALIKIAPQNVDGLFALGSAMSSLKRYGESVPTFEAALAVAPDRAYLYAQLGYAYMNLGNDDKALPALKKAVDLDPRLYNDVAYSVADANKYLPLALEFAQKAVRDVEEASAKVQLADLKVEDLERTSRLAAYWDTLGWVFFRTGNLEQAEKYLNAAWTLSQNATVSDHLRQVRKRQHRDATLPDASAMRTIKLNRLVPGTASAEFFVILARYPKTSKPQVADVKFISGSEKLRVAAKALSSARFTVPFPDDGPTHLLRRGILGCYEYTGCSFVVLNPDDVRSVN